MGRPSAYSAEVASEICRQMAEGKSLRSICQAEDMPADSTVRLWAIEDREGFSAQYARAREAQVEALAEDILEIADDSKHDVLTDSEGRDIVQHEIVARARLRVDSRKWLMSKIAPKRYGDKVTQEVSGPDGGPIPIAKVERVITRPNASDRNG